MNYESLISTLTEIVNNDLIYKKGLMLTYKLPFNRHKKLNEHIFFKMNPNTSEVYEYTEEFEIEFDGIVIKFVIDNENTL